jgi:hypothetical protein
MTKHKTTLADCWQDPNYIAELRELRSRVEALENDRRAILDSNSRRRIGLDVAEPAVTRDRDETGDYVIVHDAPESSDSLVELVADAIYRNGTIRVIHVIADWLDQQELHVAATRLRMEVR